MRIRNFKELLKMALEEPPARLVVAGGETEEVAEAVTGLLSKGLISSALVTGDVSKMECFFSGSDRERVELIDVEDPVSCSRSAVAAIRSGQANVLMKGHVDSTSYLRAVVDRQTGLRNGSVLSNITVAEIPGSDRLLVATDNGILPLPDLDQKRQIVLNTAPLFRGLGVTPVRVAAICATEKVTDALPATGHARALAAECLDGNFEGFEIGGPMGYDVAVSSKAARAKGLENLPASGNADLMLFANIDAANAVAKSWKFHGQARTGSIVLGASVPVLLNSRSDSAERRENAFLLASAVLKGQS
ncbi:phosphate acyltransferase [Sulfitobacter mediterraneus]|jgi:phosphate butyryltransferase|uniref:phosphate acyltransferase n=1 Tax=Sulfitobacter mediterraneus TaxID=83219 RepID=UPI0021A442E5|nr:phosphate acyltransferase [Sulfitobacter mediterraneus]UWR12437.1 hypothetical protein K3753_06130 [Sulfitobacter mediterraneus]